jgi:hypothetical protein
MAFIMIIGIIINAMNLISVLVSFNGIESIHHINLSRPQNIFNPTDSLTISRSKYRRS